VRTARERRRWIVGLIILWNTAGTVATVVWRDQLWWVQAMSHAAITIGLGAWFFAETPVEPESGDANS
jgi:ABC-type Mn2+/Zn2+ transport system permease subunit